MPAAESLTPGQQLAEDTWPKLDNLTSEERKVYFDILMGRWCQNCGRQHPGYVCQCENDD